MASSIRTTVHESLPYIDKEPTEPERAAAEALIKAEQALLSPPPPATATTYTPTFTPLIQAELERISKKEPLSGIDVSRYEIQDAPTIPDTSDTTDTITALTTPLTRAYATHTYLRGRQAHLNLLDAYGKNAWLVGNWQAEAGLAALERDLAAVKRDVDVVNLQRQRLQAEVGEELKGLEDAWRRGVGRVLETEVAVEALRLQVLERRRGAA